jgi:hypothetical protein
VVAHAEHIVGAVLCCLLAAYMVAYRDRVWCALVRHLADELRAMLELWRPFAGLVLSSLTQIEQWLRDQVEAGESAR